MDINEEIYKELVKIRSLLERLAKKELKEDLESVASTNERKIIWSLCDGLNNTSEIASKTRVSQRAVQLFIKELAEKDLIIVEERGRPKRKYDYIPSDWQIKGE